VNFWQPIITQKSTCCVATARRQKTWRNSAILQCLSATHSKAKREPSGEKGGPLSADFWASANMDSSGACALVYLTCAIGRNRQAEAVHWSTQLIVLWLHDFGPRWRLACLLMDCQLGGKKNLHSSTCYKVSLQLFFVLYNYMRHQGQEARKKIFKISVSFCS
jgi:hypothetical protein